MVNGIYLETNAIRKLTDYNCENRVFTSVFAIFELVAGICERDFGARRAALKRVFDSEIYIKNKMVDQIICEFADINDFDPEVHKNIYLFAKSIIDCSNYNEFVIFAKSHPSNMDCSVLEWLQGWDEKISNIRFDAIKMFKDEDEKYIKTLYKERGIEGLAEHFENKINYNMIDEERLGHAAGFCQEAEIKAFRERTEQKFLQFKLFFVAQAIIFAKAKFIDGGNQDRNNPSDILHLLYLEEGDKLVSNDKIYDTIAKGIKNFRYVKLNEEKKLSELVLV